jgi:hypothetical protein
MLTEGMVRAGCPCKGVGDIDRRRRRDDLAGRAAAGVLRLLGFTDRHGVVL